MTIVSESVRYPAGETQMQGRLFWDPARSDPLPGILVFPEGFGISEHTYEEAAQIAELGYVTLACDLYGEAFFNNGPTPELYQRNELTLSRLGLFGIGDSALRFLTGQRRVDPHRIAACGYCLGATVAVELALQQAPLLAVAGFHPSLEGLSLQRAAAVSCPVHLFMGAEDYATPPEKRATFERAFTGSGMDWRITVYGNVKHSYTNRYIQGMGDRCAYDEEAHQHSLAQMYVLFQRELAKSRQGLKT